jgi:hypothetical protein
MLSSSWCSLFWEQPQTGAGVGGGGFTHTWGCP